MNRQKNYRSFSQAVLNTYSLTDFRSVRFVTSYGKDEIILTAAEVCTFQYPKYTTSLEFLIRPSTGTTIKIVTEVNCLYTETLIVKNTKLLIFKFSCKISLSWPGSILKQCTEYYGIFFQSSLSKQASNFPRPILRTSRLPS